jgi:hypothetical protein
MIELNNVISVGEALAQTSHVPAPPMEYLRTAFNKVHDAAQDPSVELGTPTTVKGGDQKKRKSAPATKSEKEEQYDKEDGFIDDDGEVEKEAEKETEKELAAVKKAKYRGNTKCLLVREDQDLAAYLIRRRQRLGRQAGQSSEIDR